MVSQVIHGDTLTTKVTNIEVLKEANVQYEIGPLGRKEQTSYLEHIISGEKYQKVVLMGKGDEEGESTPGILENNNIEDCKGS